MARHTPSPARRRLALGAGLTAAAMGAALAAGEAAHAAPAALAPPVGGLDPALTGPAAGVTGAVTNSVTGIGYLKSHQLNPLAKTGVDPLSNGIGTQIADFKPVSTELLTGPLAEGAALQDLPVVGGAAKALPL
ncbi:hypothetical protein ACFYT4_10950 [Streptomyces sp. NPDC004609]|uniref:hypothetical protein n=1 Tax=Streptomyces sp. NPDC004609 TaxID=3364704 RepID=UPI00368EBF98